MPKLRKDKQEVFCNEYIIDFNATQAAIRAGYSAKTAKQAAHRLFTFVYIQDRISELLRERSKRTQVTQDRVLLEIAHIAFNDPRKAFDEQGNLLPIYKWPDEVAAAVSSIEIIEQKKEGETSVQLKRVRFWDKGKQIEMAAKHLEMFTERTAIDQTSRDRSMAPVGLPKVKFRFE